MDMSKLPRLSNTQQHTPPPATADDPSQAPPPEQPIPARPEPPYSEPPMTQGMLLGAEVWLAGILGIIFMLFGKNFGIWLAKTITGATYHTNVTWSQGHPLAGQEVPYTQLDASMGMPFWTDASVFLFGLAMVFEALVLTASSSSRLRRPLITTALGITILAIGFNLFAIAKLMSNGITPIISLLATAFGVYIAMYEWALLKATNPAPPRAL